ncbi:MAG: 30S ribosomal protein S16 [Acidobacteriota bacterium]
MVAIRLRRAGSKKRPFFRIVVADSRGACDSSFVEILGHYNPRTKPAIVKVDAERVQYWLQHGAQPSDSVRTLMARHLTPVPVEPAVAAPAKPAVETTPAPVQPAVVAAEPAVAAAEPAVAAAEPTVEAAVPPPSEGSAQ